MPGGADNSIYAATLYLGCPLSIKPTVVPTPQQTDLLALADEYVGSHHSTARTCTEGSHTQFQMGRILSFHSSFLDPILALTCQD